MSVMVDQSTPEALSSDMSPESGPLLSVSNLRKSYGSVHALKGVDLELAKGEVVAVCGRSGSGKSTMIRCINFVEIPDHGSIRVRDVTVDAGPMTRERMRRIRSLRTHTGMVFQSFNLFPHKTALANVTEGLVVVKRLPPKQAERIGIQLLESVGLGEKCDVYPNRLSGGQQQRVAIARALAMDPDLLLVDEPTSALDPELIGEVLAVLRKLADSGTTMIIVTHEIGFAIEVADRLIYIDDGEILEEGNPKELVRSPSTASFRRFLESVAQS